MSRKIVAVESVGHDDKREFYVFCDDGTIWTWVPPSYRSSQRKREAWTELDPPLPQTGSGDPVLL